MLKNLKKIKKKLAKLGLLLAALSGSASYAKELPLGKPFEYVATKEPLADLLKNFAGSQGIPIVVSDKIKQVVNGQFQAKNPKTFLDDISTVFGLIWFYDGSLLYINKSDEMQSKMIRVGDVSPDKLRRNMIDLGIFDQRFSWRHIPGQKMIFVSGPPRLVEMVSEITKFISDEESKTINEATSVRLFKLKYALAHDRSYSSRGQTTVVKGLATVLKEIIVGINSSADVNGLDQNASGAEKPESMPHHDKEPKAKASNQSKPLDTASLDGRITADKRLNAIVINDRPEKMPMYKALIESLDVASEQVEISVSIMDISSEKLSELGFDWQNSGSDGSIKFGSANTDANPSGAASGSYGVQTIVAAKAGQFLGKIKMLSEDGEAQIFSRPVVLTKDMVEAVVDNSSTFYVRVSGKEDVELFPITYGTLMRVTPRIVDEDEARWIHLDINIEDGQASNEGGVDQIPSVKKTSINTQSMIPNGDSLLIGGYIYSNKSEVQSGIPFLEDIPLLGYFFSWNADTARQWVRLFMISPRTVTRSDMLKNTNHPTLKNSYQDKFSKNFVPKKVEIEKAKNAKASESDNEGEKDD